MNIENMKIAAQIALESAQGKISLNNNVTMNILDPTIFGISGNDIIPYFMNIENDEDKKKVPIYLKKLAKAHEGIIIVILIKIIEEEIDVGKEEIDMGKEIGNISDDPNAINALSCFIYTKDKSKMRIARFIPGIEGFFDDGWKETKLDYSENFINPFDQIENVEY